MQVKLSVVAGPHQGKEFLFTEHDNFIVGRGLQAHFRLAKLDQYFSRLHFMIEVNPPFCRAVDLNSRNGIQVNDQKTRSADLSDGDIIRAGKTKILVSIVKEPSPPEDAFPSTITGSPSSKKAERPTSKTPPPPRSRDSSAVIPARPRNDSDAAIETLDEVRDQIISRETLSPPVRKLLPDDYEEQISRHRQLVPGYQIVRELGHGGMGVVYLAIRQQDHSVVALKTILPAVVASARQKERFLREARILQELQHPHIVAFREMGEHDGLLFFAMDYVPGKDAAQLLREHGPLPVARAVKITCQMLDALEFAHSRGFVHRDIKPSNLLVVSEDGQDTVKLADFGLARVYQTSQLSGLTMTGDIGGTPRFMPPEQIVNYRDAQPATDQYAAAATLYNLLTDCHLYDFLPSVGAQLVMILQEKPVPIEQRRAELPQELVQSVHRAIHRNVSERFGSVGEFRRALQPFAG